MKCHLLVQRVQRCIFISWADRLKAAAAHQSMLRAYLHCLGNEMHAKGNALLLTTSLSGAVSLQEWHSALLWHVLQI